MESTNGPGSATAILSKAQSQAQRPGSRDNGEDLGGPPEDPQRHVEDSRSEFESGLVD